MTSHIRPDCDALGSELGLAGVLDALGKDVLIVNGQRTPPHLQFIDPAGRIEVLEDVAPERLSGIDVLVILDTSAWAQLGPLAEVVRTTAAQKIVIDHHLSEDPLEATFFKDTAAEATGRLIVELAEACGVSLTSDIARPLFTAIATDTGWFRFPSVSAHTYRIAARLMDAGADPTEIYRQLYERDSLGRLRLRGTVLRRITTELQGRLAHTYLRQEDFAETGAAPSDTEELVNLALGIDGTEAALIFIELASGGYKVSFRSRCPLDCSQVAALFGGGGHKAAAGATVQGSLEDVQKRVLDVVRTRMR